MTNHDNPGIARIKHLVRKEKLSIGSDALEDSELKDRDPIMGDWLFKGDLVLLFSWRGIGKTFVSLWLALCIAAGRNFLRWKAHNHFRVAFFDGEMGRDQMSRRLNQLKKCFPSLPAEHLVVFSYDSFPDERMPNLSLPDGQQRYREIAEHFDVLIFDNYSCVSPRKRGDDDISRFERVRPFLIEMRHKEKSVILLHHSGKSGEQRGTSELEDPQDTIIKLSKATFTPDGMSAFEWHFEKTRNFYGESERPMHVEFTTSADGATHFQYMRLDDARKIGIRQKLMQCNNPYAVASFLKVPLIEVLSVQQTMDGDSDDN